MSKPKCDFSGWATVHDVRCIDGLTIRKNAFKDDDGRTVPLVWQHQHNDPENVLGNVLLHNTEQGVYAYCSFNDSEKAQHAKELIRHGDIRAMSIHANQLKKNGNDVVHGVIREVSLVLAGANPGAFIDCANLEHSDESEFEGVIYTDQPITSEDIIEHADNNEGEKNMAETNQNEKTVKDVFDSMTEEQKQVVYFLVGKAAAENSAEHSAIDEDEEETTLKHNVFENDTPDNSLSHDEMMSIINDGKRYGSLKESFLQHGITDIETLFPEPKSLNNPPEWIKPEDDWVAEVMGSVHHTPFSRIKSVFADITEDDARALGYLPDRTHRDAKGNLVDAEGNPAYKKEEVFGLLKRTTTPATVYKKQKLDRDDVIDITDFDVIAWLKAEMRMMLNLELARAFLIGDGRAASSDDKINESNIRPIWKDEDLFTIKTAIEVAGTETPDQMAKMVIRTAVKSRKKYKGSGNPVFYTTEDWLTDMLLMEDSTGRRIYNNAADVAAAMRVRKIVTVPQMENQTRVDDTDHKTHTLVGLIVNLADYNVGADKGGAVSMFDDFDIDYNAQKYLIETRCSGALTKPYSAIAIETVPQGA